jgi:hypothetical protein
MYRNFEFCLTSILKISVLTILVCGCILDLQLLNKNTMSDLVAIFTFRIYEIYKGKYWFHQKIFFA